MTTRDNMPPLHGGYRPKPRTAKVSDARAPKPPAGPGGGSNRPDRDADNVPSDRVRAYGEVIWTTSRNDEGTISATGANIVARAVMAVADREQAELRAENERLRGDDERRTGWMNSQVDHLNDYADRAQKAEATIARVEALHVQIPNDPEFCAEDGFTWPCATVRALRGPEPNPEGA